jgi:hypothetical protein
MIRQSAFGRFRAILIAIAVSAVAASSLPTGALATNNCNQAVATGYEMQCSVMSCGGTGSCVQHARNYFDHTDYYCNCGGDAEPWCCHLIKQNDLLNHFTGFVPSGDCGVFWGCVAGRLCLLTDDGAGNAYVQCYAEFPW